MKPNNEMAGKRYGILLVLPKEEGSGISHNRVPCLCDCGKRLIVTKHMLATGKTTDCGCVMRDRKTNAMFPLRIKGLDDLADAIIARAAADYRMTFMRYLKDKDKNEYNLAELRRFFRSDWCEMLTELNTEVLMNRIEQDCITEFERTKKRGKHKNQVPEGHTAD